MNTLRKTLMAATMVVTLGMTTSCGNKEDSQVFVAGTPYTLAVLILNQHEECTIEFGCEGTPTTYWDYANSPDQSDHEKRHTYTAESRFDSHPVILIEGNISSLWFCDEKGVPLQDGNVRIGSVIFSNTITSIREYACYGLRLEGAYIPASVKTMGKYAFMPHEPKAFFCEPPVRPSGWDVYWCTLGEYNRIVTWGLSYHVTEETGEVYLLIADDDVQTAFYQGNAFTTSDTLVIPKKIKVNNRDFVVAAINDMDNARNIKSITIPDSIVLIGGSAFQNCIKLTEVKFEGNFAYLQLGTDVFWSCTSLKTITLPEGLIDLPPYTFEGCVSLNYVKIPSSIEEASYNVFSYASTGLELTIDLTAFKDPNKIAKCNSSFLSGCEANKVTFKIDSSLTEEHFTAKKWPKTESTRTPNIVWDNSPTSLA